MVKHSRRSDIVSVHKKYVFIDNLAEFNEYACQHGGFESSIHSPSYGISLCPRVEIEKVLFLSYIEDKYEGYLY